MKTILGQRENSNHPWRRLRKKQNPNLAIKTPIKNKISSPKIEMIIFQKRKKKLKSMLVSLLSVVTLKLRIWANYHQLSESKNI